VPQQPAVLRILEDIGGQLQPLGVPERAQFDCASAILSYILGLAGQYAAGARLLPASLDFILVGIATIAPPKRP
jgi:hypothetical protein